MSKVFLCLALLFSGFMLLVAVAGSNPSKSVVIVFWLVIGAGSAYKLFNSSAKA